MSSIITFRGEEFFRHISHKFGWTRHPMGKRMVEDLPISVGITFIFGTRTFITRKPSIILQNKRGEDNVVINVRLSLHSVYSSRWTTAYNDLLLFVIISGK